MRNARCVATGYPPFFINSSTIKAWCSPNHAMVYIENGTYTAVRQRALYHCTRSSLEAMPLSNWGVLSAASCISTKKSILFRSPTWSLQLLYRWGGWGIQSFFVSRSRNSGPNRAFHPVRNSGPVSIKLQHICVLKCNEHFEIILLSWRFSHDKTSTARSSVITLFLKWNVSLRVLPSNTVVYEAASQRILPILSIYFSSYKR